MADAATPTMSPLTQALVILIPIIATQIIVPMWQGWLNRTAVAEVKAKQEINSAAIVEVANKQDANHSELTGQMQDVKNSTDGMKDQLVKVVGAEAFQRGTDEEHVRGEKKASDLVDENKLKGKPE